MAETIDMQQSALKTSVWKIDRENIDLKSEMEMIVELFSLIRPQALVGYQIDEGAEYPCLDKVYFYYLILCLVDKAICICRSSPRSEDRILYRQETLYVDSRR